MADDLNRARALGHASDKAGWEAERILAQAQKDYETSHPQQSGPHTGCLIAMAVVGSLILVGTAVALGILLAGNRSAIERVLARDDRFLRSHH